MKHFLQSRSEYANEWGDDVIASQFSMYFVYNFEIVENYGNSNYHIFLMAYFSSDWHHIFTVLFNYFFTLSIDLKHKDSFGRSENLSKYFFGEILEFDHDYEGISSSSNDLLWITFI